MTVKELIEKLSTLDPESEILVLADEDGAAACYVSECPNEDSFPYLKSGDPEELGFDFEHPVVVIGG